MNPLAPWLEMWLLCFALFGAAKLTVLGRTRGLDAGGRLAFLGLWVGMDAEAFCGRRTVPGRPGVGEWLWAAGKTLFGLVLTWGVAGRMMQFSPLLAGWVGMTGLIFCLHFGSFHLLALAWRWLGYPVTALMDRPHRATTLAEFWSRRWNRAFHRLTHELVWQPACRRWESRVALWLGFLGSGVVHDLIISVPARGGWGGPTGYFLLQAVGLSLQRTVRLRRLGLAGGVRGWLWTLLFVVAPTPLLFHGPFVERVMLPFLHVLKAW